MRMSRSSAVWVFMFAVAASLVFANLLSVRYFKRFDLTDGAKFTLTAGSKKTVANLADTVIVTAYFSEGMPAPYASYARYVRDMLEEYRAASNGRIAFEFIDPLKEENDDDKQKKKEAVRDAFGAIVREPTSVENELMQLGIQPVEIRVVEDDQQQSKRAYMGLVIRYQGKKEVMSVVQDFSKFEKDLTVRIRKLTRKKLPVVGVVTDEHVASVSKVKALLSEMAYVRELTNADLKEAPQVDALVVMAASDLSDEALKTFDAFIAQGKNAAFFVDQHVFNTQTLKQASHAEKGTKWREWLKQYGVVLGEGLVADAQSQDILVQDQDAAYQVRYPLFPLVTSLDQDNAITYGLSNVVFPFVSPIALTSEAKGELIAKSSDASWIESEPLNTDPGRVWRSQEAKWSGSQGLVASLRVGAKNSRVVIAGTSAFAWDDYLTPENQAFTMASIDYVLADDVMLSLHGRHFEELLLDRSVSDSKRMVIKYGNMLGIPALLALYGLVRWRRREWRRRKTTLDTI